MKVNNVGWRPARWCVAHHPNDGEGGIPSVTPNYRNSELSSRPRLSSSEEVQALA
jgi:hypothetical protein